MYITEMFFFYGWVQFVYSCVVFVFRLEEMEELYEAKCREGEVGNIFFYCVVIILFSGLTI